MTYNWTSKRKAALEYLIQAKGNISEASRIAGVREIRVSHSYLKDLRNRPEHKPFRKRYEERTGSLLSALEVDSEWVISRIVEIADSGESHSVRLRALESLGREYVKVLQQQKIGGDTQVAVVIPLYQQSLLGWKELVDAIILLVPESEHGRAQGLVGEHVAWVEGRISEAIPYTEAETGIFRPLLQDKE